MLITKDCSTCKYEATNIQFRETGEYCNHNNSDKLKENDKGICSGWKRSQRHKECQYYSTSPYKVIQ